MKRTFTILLAALLSGYVPYLAVAAGDTGSKAAMRIGGSEIAAKSVESTALIPGLYDDLYVAGTVTSVDPRTGMVGLNTDVQGPLQLQFHPAALKKLKVGDVAVVYLGFSIDDRTISAESCDLLAIKVASC